MEMRSCLLRAGIAALATELVLSILGEIMQASTQPYGVWLALELCPFLVEHLSLSSAVSRLPTELFRWFPEHTQDTIFPEAPTAETRSPSVR